MDSKEEQEQELEALQAIYPNELEVIGDEYPDISFLVRLTTKPSDFDDQNINQEQDEKDSEDDEDEEMGDEHLYVTLTVQWPADYPSSSACTVGLTGLDDLLDETRLSEIVNSLETAAQENIGMACTFTLVTTLQEQLLSLADELERLKQEEKERHVREQEEADRQKIEGTKVTVESFMSWKLKFDADMLALREKKIKKSAANNTRPTGRQQFLSDQSLSISDVALVDDAALDIDESLFDDVGDLELSDDEQ